jgi:hypothetical protein
MGANTFGNTGKGKTAAEAFKALVDSDRHENGHSYSGSIGMKNRFVMITVPTGQDPYDYANTLLDNGDRRVDDKFGPAGCVQVKPDEWYFFGWASS